MTNLFEFSKQLKKTIAIFQSNPTYYDTDGITRISAPKSKTDPFSAILSCHSIEQILMQPEAQDDDFPYLLIGVLKLSFATSTVSTDSLSKVAGLEAVLKDDAIEHKTECFLEFYDALKVSDSIEDILLAQIIHDFIHIAYNILLHKDVNQMTARNCGITFAANIANLLKIDPTLGLTLNGVVTTLIEGPLFSDPFVFDGRMRDCLMVRQHQLSLMVADMALQADKATQSFSLLNDSIAPTDVSEVRSKVKHKEKAELKRRFSKSETDAISILEKIDALKRVMTAYEFEQAQLGSVLEGGLDAHKPAGSVLISPRDSSHSPRASGSPRRFIPAGSNSSIGGSSSSSSSNVSNVSTPIHFPPPVFDLTTIGRNRNRSNSCTPMSSSVPGLGFSLLRQVVSPRGTSSTSAIGEMGVSSLESEPESESKSKSGSELKKKKEKKRKFQ
jgi:hypothetical protein